MSSPVSGDSPHCHWLVDSLIFTKRRDSTMSLWGWFLLPWSYLYANLPPSTASTVAKWPAGTNTREVPTFEKNHRRAPQCALLGVLDFLRLLIFQLIWTLLGCQRYLFHDVSWKRTKCFVTKETRGSGVNLNTKRSSSICFGVFMVDSKHVFGNCRESEEIGDVIRLVAKCSSCLSLIYRGSTFVDFMFTKDAVGW